jgi:DNA-binding IscR family transcriptional regulator
MLSQKTRYTIRALQHLADTFGQGPVRLDAIADAQNIPRKFLTVILSEMAREGSSFRSAGAKGDTNWPCRRWTSAMATSSA